MQKKHIGLTVLGGFVLAIVLVVLLWDWNWFKPLVEAQASTALGRKVTIGRLHVALGRVTEVTADDVAVANPADFPGGGNFATIGRLAIDADVMAYVRDRLIVLPRITVDKPDVAATQLDSGAANWNFKLASAGDSNANAPASPGPKIGDLVINDGNAHVVAPKLKTDMTLAISTVPAANANESRIQVDAKGTYAAQPITGRFLGGALLSLRDAASPYPVDLHAANGATHIALVGTVQNPLAFAGADLKLELSGQDMANLYPLTGIPIPQTPPYRVAGNLDYADHKIRFHDFTGRVGSSDLNGTIAVDPGKERPQVIADLNSKQIDLQDLGGFIGSTPGRATTPDQTPAQRAATTRAEDSPKFLPTKPINLPKLNAADVQLKYRGGHIEGRSMPLDNLVVDMDIKDGNIDLHPLSFGVGRGQIASTISLAQAASQLHMKGKVDFKQVDVSRLMASTHLFHGAGTIGGTASIDSTGDSVATLLGNGNGEVHLFMSGGDLSAILVDLSGFQFGNAILSALGVPSTAQVRCMVTDLALVRGVLQTRILAIDTSESDIHGSGDINFRTETLDYKIKTEANHFTIGAFKAPINITGTFKSPSIRPDAVTLGLRAGAAAGLGFLFPPLALLPTIQLGLGEHNDCEAFLQRSVKR